MLVHGMIMKLEINARLYEPLVFTQTNESSIHVVHYIYALYISIHISDFQYQSFCWVKKALGKSVNEINGKQNLKYIGSVYLPGNHKRI